VTESQPWPGYLFNQMPRVRVTKKYDRPCAIWSWEDRYFSFPSLSYLFRALKLTVKTGVYTDHNEAVLISFHGSPHISILVRVCLPFPFAYSRTNTGKRNTPTACSLRTSNFPGIRLCAHPTLSLSLPASFRQMYRSKVHPENSTNNTTT